jgi:hypothetical protein
VGGEDDRQRQPFDPLDGVDQLLPEAAGPLRRKPVELGHVDAAGDGAALSADQQRPRRLGLERFDSRQQALEHAAVEEIERRTVERQQRQANGVALDSDDCLLAAHAGRRQ